MYDKYMSNRCQMELESNGIVQAYYIDRLDMILMFSEVNSFEFPAQL